MSMSMFSGIYSSLYSALASILPNGQMYYVTDDISLLDLFLALYLISMLICVLTVERGGRKALLFTTILVVFLAVFGVLSNDDLTQVTDELAEASEEAILTVLYSSGDILINVEGEWVTPTAITGVSDITDEGLVVTISGVSTAITLEGTRVIDLTSDWSMLEKVTDVTSREDGTVAVTIGVAEYIFTPDNLHSVLGN